MDPKIQQLPYEIIRTRDFSWIECCYFELIPEIQNYSP